MQTNRAYYEASSSQFVLDDPAQILGHLTAATPFSVERTQRDAWQTEISQLRELAKSLPNAHFFLEFTIPRMGRRADCIILWRGVVFVVEYKVGASQFQDSALDQVLGYALDLVHFHEPSHNLTIVPILVATLAQSSSSNLTWREDRVAEPLTATPSTLRSLLDICTQTPQPEIEPRYWEGGRYRPTPTIIEAAQALYAGHAVEEISRSEAGAENLTATAAYVDTVIERAKREQHKAICFITGVPGSGKTLAGLNLATRRMRGNDGEHAVFLSGNGPLVNVLREALVRDAIAQRSQAQGATSRAAEISKASAFIQNIHHFRDEALVNPAPLAGKIVIFDEAQRAWNVAQTAKFMSEKRGQHGFSASEPEFLLSVMDRNPDWCVVVCLIGGGQEINTGEAGLQAWLEALGTQFTTWKIYFASQLLGSEYGLEQPTTHAAVERATRSPHLHLTVSVRSFRAEKVSEFVAALLSGNSSHAREIHAHLANYPMAIVRDLSLARAWLSAQRRGLERSGLLASSNALRLKADGIFMDSEIDPVNWFLAPRKDVRGSDALEGVASEFDVQGLELDWGCLCWDGNLRRQGGAWDAWKFSGSSWKRIRDPARQAFLMNSYRVLLTRARQGLVIFVPRGDSQDSTREPAIYDGIFNYLVSCGIGPSES